MAKKKNLTPTEYEDQCRIFRTVNSYIPIYPELRFMHASLSGVKMTIGQAVKMQKSGCLKKGIPDIEFPLRRGGWNGLYIELKRVKGGKVSIDQREWAEFLKKQGHKHHFCYGFDDAWNRIYNYLEGIV